MYVDESGDPGLHQYGPDHFILSGLIIMQDNWLKYLQRLKTFRKEIKKQYKLNQRTEIHAAELIRIKKNKEYRKITKSDRIAILKEFCRQIPIIFDEAKIINVALKKSDFKETREIQRTAWIRLIQRFDLFLKKSVEDKGIIIADDTETQMIIQQMRKMRIYNPVKSHYGGFYNSVTDSVLEDLFQRNSADSYFIQAVDVVAHLLYRKEYPKGSLKKFGLDKIFDVLKPILLKEASYNDPLGIVRK